MIATYNIFYLHSLFYNYFINVTKDLLSLLMFY